MIDDYNINMTFTELLETNPAYATLSKVDNFTAAIAKIEEYLPNQVMESYIQQYTDPGFDGGPTRFLHPVDLFLAGQQLLMVEAYESDATIAKLKKKFRQIKLADSQLKDLLAELNITGLIVPHYEIQLDKATGVGKKDSDLYLPEIDLFIEVKNYEFGKSVDQVTMNNAYQSLSDEEREGKQYVLEDGELKQQGSVKGMKSVAMITDPRKLSSQYENNLSAAEAKFKPEHDAVVVMTGIHNVPLMLHTVNNWASLRENSPVKSVLIVGRRNTENLYEVHEIKIHDSEKVKSLLKNLGLNP